MRRICFAVGTVLMTAVLAVWPSAARAQGAFELVSGQAFDSAVPKDFYLEGNAIPTQKRNAALLKTPAGARVLFALIDTTGYSSQIQQKYEGMIINEGKVTLCGHAIGVGSYGFGGRLLHRLKAHRTIRSGRSGSSMRSGLAVPRTSWPA